MPYRFKTLYRVIDVTHHSDRERHYLLPEHSGRWSASKAITMKDHDGRYFFPTYDLLKRAIDPLPKPEPKGMEFWRRNFYHKVTRSMP